MYYIIILAVVLLDQLIKAWVVNGMVLGESLAIIEGIFHITYIHNTGAAFSFLQGYTALLIALPLVVTTLILAYITVKRKIDHPLLLWALALIVAGGIGNLIDRVRMGYVVDLFDFRVFPIFNVADISVCCGCGLLIIYILVIEPKVNKNDESCEHDETIS